MNKNSVKVVNYRIRVKQKLIAYKGGKCKKCGYDKPVPGVYHFHHRGNKSFSINGSTLGFERLKAEADKCDLLCANCHAELHDEAWRDRRAEALLAERRPLEDKPCSHCHENFKPKRKEQIFCTRSCQHESMKLAIL